jgi:transcriptional regulator with XRE-family HTH domain
VGTGQDQDRFGTSPGRLAPFIREERARRSLSRRDLAEMVCGAARVEGERNARVSETTVKRWEQGQVPSQSHMRWLASALGRPVERLVALARQSPAGGPVPAPLDAAVDEERLVFVREHPHEIDARRQLPTRRRRVEGVRAVFLSHASDHPAVQGFDERLRAAIG